MLLNTSSLACSWRGCQGPSEGPLGDQGPLYLLTQHHREARESDAAPALQHRATQDSLTTSSEATGTARDKSTCAPCLEQHVSLSPKGGNNQVSMDE